MGSATVQNGSAANNALDALHATREQEHAEFSELEATRDALEERSDASIDTSDAEPFEMTDSRQIGTVSITTDVDGNVRFGKPNGRASLALDTALNGAEQSGQDSKSFYYWVWTTLAEWSLDAEKNTDYWADEYGFLDCIQLIRSLTLGGNARPR